MRTTITIEDDIAGVLQALRKEKEKSFKEIINEALRAGLAVLAEQERRPDERYHTEPVRLGPRLPSLDNTAEVLALSEGERFR